MTTKISETGEASLPTTIREKYNKLERLWIAAEESLRAFCVPCSVEYALGRFERDGVTCHHALRWARSNGTRRICYEVWSDTWPESELKPILECTVEVRAAMAEHFASLRDAVIAAARVEISRLEAAITVLSTALGEG